MAEPPAIQAVPNHELVLQLATERHVHAFDLKDKFRVTLGRHHSNDVQLRSRRVSSHHAEILIEVEGIFVRDMGSTNGTFVNDESVKRQKLESGDRIRIGNFSITVKIVPRTHGGEEDSKDELYSIGAIGNVLPFRGETTPAGGWGRTDATLPELLTELARRGASVMVSIRNQNDEGRIYLSGGEVVHCELNSVRKEKALHRLLALQKGRYEILELPSSPSVPRTMTLPTESLVVEGMQQVEALDKLSAKLPPVMYEIALNESCERPVSMLTADELSIYQDLIRFQTLVRLLEESPLTDFMVLLLVHGLLQRGFFKATRNSGGLVEETMISESRAS